MGLDYTRGKSKLANFMCKLLDLAAAKYGDGVLVDRVNSAAVQMQVLNCMPAPRTGDGGDCGYLWKDCFVARGSAIDFPTCGPSLVPLIATDLPHLDGRDTGWVVITSIGDRKSVV